MTKQKSFEESIERLEEILEKMNSEDVSLDDSIALFEEADGLIKTCNKRLESAEKKVEKLIKNREGEVELDDEGNPLTEPL
ncbi:MAG: exodeoxyribonuclease VII small subunit [Chlamydiia bacterium]|nr:exodeoxyribonuclease VII small subunit [Chlamydiia bacterium]